MAKKVIQVPVDEGLLEELDNLSRKQRRARSELIRQACRTYLRQTKQEEMDKVYKLGYQKIPEEAELGEAQVTAVGETISRESW
ncbi:MAG: ribbon-helix-helix protein, CopG family [Dehalococcoidales bacterium]|nr:ribbon-helix-helix protein, CopG family [Dehalococcoidales bacterium]